MQSNKIKLLSVVFVLMGILSGCTGTTYNKDMSCSTDYLLVPALSVPAILGACESRNTTNKK